MTPVVCFWFGVAVIQWCVNRIVLYIVTLYPAYESHRTAPWTLLCPVMQ